MGRYAQSRTTVVGTKAAHPEHRGTPMLVFRIWTWLSPSLRAFFLKP
jgi:hypothetical protein